MAKLRIMENPLPEYFSLFKRLSVMILTVVGSWASELGARHGSIMPLEGELKHRLERALSVVDDHGTRGTRLLEDAQRICARVKRLIGKGVIATETDPSPIEVCCYA